MILSYMTWLCSPLVGENSWQGNSIHLCFDPFIIYIVSVECSHFYRREAEMILTLIPPKCTNKNAFLHYLPIRQDKLNLNKTYHLYCLSALHGHHNNIIILNHHSCNMIWLLNTWCVKVHLVILFCIICWLYKSMLIRIQLFVIFTT